MKKLHIKQNNQWKPVFCNMGGKVITCDDKRKALPTQAIWGKDDLKHFRNKFGNDEFCLM